MFKKLQVLASIYSNMARINFKTFLRLRELKKRYQPLIIRKNSTDEHVFQQIFLYDDYAIGDLNFAPKCIVDAGAYVGYASLYFDSQYPDAEIVSIEPSDTNFPTLAQNTENLRNIRRFKAGLWHKEAYIRIVDRQTGNWGFMIEEVGEKEKHDLKTITVPYILEQTNWPHIDIFKIDIEGSEFELFSENFESWIGKVRVFIIEFHDRIKPGSTDAFLNAISPFTWKQFQRGENLIFIREDWSE